MKMWNSYLKHLGVLLVIVFLSGFGFNKIKPGTTLQIRVIPVFNGQPLELENKYYITENGDSVFIDIFKMYLSNIALSDGGKNSFKPGQYFLLDAADSSSMVFSLNNVPEAAWSEISFMIGADSTANISGALEGALDPVNGMYWAWNTGYINAKLAGRSNSCKTLHHTFEYHIGGYLKPFKTQQLVRLRLEEIKMQNETHNSITIYADVAEWFKKPALIDVAKLNSVVMPDKNSVMLSENYADMFSIKK